MPHAVLPTVVSVAGFIGVEPIDGGDTIAVRFKAPDDGEITILVPQKAIADLQTALTDRPERDRFRQGRLEP
ncbi:hypothetical protein [Methylobacterium sp. Leaf399]|uniref:hypothetical protein n=1 Tax=Methylobacterium sp. Leaf399 TaxID=1736364 RepID=UPI0009E97447|nr:hypothetical protein [Methylobacterium sp. Leaf399]